ncbi:MAG: nucleotidyltransferase domain-containing protein [Promethearchaeota archaeon]|nr:MAG: nucleotidyltransferase domain-containing protein [Candidatus Lokiarchaeota archaeon]
MQLKNIDNLNLPERARFYLHKLIQVLEKTLGDRVHSIIMFGSLVKGYATKVSDADILIIVSDDCTKREITFLNRLIMAFEVKFKYLIPPRGIVSQILYSVDKSTGMFISHFIVRKKDFINGNFAKTFQVNRLVAKVLAPNEIVYGSVLCRAKVVFGHDLISERIFSKVRRTQLLKSILMNLVTSLLALCIFPITKRATLYEMESAKWSMLAAYYYVKHDSPQLPILLKYFIERDISANYVKRWMSLRSFYQPDFKFGMLTPLNILKIHIGALKQK